MTREELAAYTNHIRLLRTSPPTMAKSLRDDPEVETPAKSPRSKPKIDVAAKAQGLLAGLEAALKAQS